MTRGFIALISVILICGFLLVIVVTLSLRSYYARLGVLEWEYKVQSRAYGHACIESIQLRVLAEPAYVGGDSVPIGDGICDIGILAENSFTVRYTYRGSSTLYRVQIEPSTRSIQRVQEIPSM